MDMEKDYVPNDLNYQKVFFCLKSEWVVDNLYDVVCQYQDSFQQKGITPAFAKEIIDLKAMLAFCPDPLSYSIKEQERVDYIYENLGNSSLLLTDENEKRFRDAVVSYFAARDEYKEKVKELKKLAFKEQSSPRSEAIAKNREIGILIDILLDEFSVENSQEPFSAINSTFKKCDLKDAYNMDDGGQALKWKAGLALEYKKLLSKGMTDIILSERGFSVDAIKAGINRNKIDRMRVWNVRLSLSEEGAEKSVCCEIDGVAQKPRVLTVEDVNRKNLLTDKKGMAIRLYKDVLDSTREKNQWLCEEKILERVSMPYPDRLLDIYRNGMTKEDVLLMNKVVDTQQSVDPFWEANNFGPHEFSVEQQKSLAFFTLADYLSDLRPGMLSDEEILHLIEVEPNGCIEEEALEQNLLRLPEPFFRLAEQSGKYDYLIDYVKVVRGMERITPRLAFSSMDHYLSHLSYEEWDPAGVDDEYGRVTGGYVRTDCLLPNPADNFPPNLLSEKQWKELMTINPKVAYEDLPLGAFKKDRVTDVQVYPYRDGNMAIRCKVDGEQQESRLLSEVDARKCTDHTKKWDLAISYFTDAFAREPEKNMVIGR